MNMKKEKKNWFTVPFRCKLNRCVKAIKGLCIKVKTDRSVSFCRDESAAPEKTFKYGTEKTISLVNIAKIICVAFVTAIAVLTILRASFSCAVLWETGKRTHKKRR